MPHLSLIDEKFRDSSEDSARSPRDGPAVSFSDERKSRKDVARYDRVHVDAEVDACAVCRRMPEVTLQPVYKAAKIRGVPGARRDVRLGVSDARPGAK